MDGAVPGMQVLEHLCGRDSFHKDAFDLLQNILEDSDVLKERVPYEKLVTTEFAEKAAAK